ncbi:DUF2024 family protein [Pseudomonas sp. MT3]|uniref:DUF2024 family protein n=1 Tax=Pseudomonas sp. ATCC 13867 TaxID=1294143 RepID=UPI0002C4EF26|nr:DUF2024 family protein [Pseudomonas sp. ATCC 13867]AGI23463.1 hypothetical protein H681_07935 [Pseudomonas sp. ATCC 13867]
MQVRVYDTHVRTHDGRYLHFDVLVGPDAASRAAEFAAHWLAARGIQAHDVHMSRCEFCHSEFSTPPVEEALRRQGYYVIEMEGC